MEEMKKLKANCYLLLFWVVFVIAAVLTMTMEVIGKTTGVILTCVGVLGIIGCVWSIQSIKKKMKNS